MMITTTAALGGARCQQYAMYFYDVTHSMEPGVAIPVIVNLVVTKNRPDLTLHKLKTVK